MALTCRPVSAGDPGPGVRAEPGHRRADSPLSGRGEAARLHQPALPPDYAHDVGVHQVRALSSEGVCDVTVGMALECGGKVGANSFECGVFILVKRRLGLISAGLNFISFGRRQRLYSNVIPYSD